MAWTLSDPRGVGRSHAPPTRHVGKRQNALNVAIFGLKIENFSGEGQCPLPRPQLVFLCINHNLVSNTLVLSPRAICIHITTGFPTSNGFWRLKRFKQSVEEWTMSCKNNAQNALKVVIFRLKIDKFSWKRPLPIGERTPAPQPPKLYCLVTKAHRCKQLAKVVMQLSLRVGFGPTTCCSQVQRATRKY